MAVLWGEEVGLRRIHGGARLHRDRAQASHLGCLTPSARHEQALLLPVGTVGRGLTVVVVARSARVRALLRTAR